MATNTAQIGTIHLKNVRLSFASLFKKKASIKDGPEKYRANFLIDPSTSIGKENIKKIEAALKEVELDKFAKSPMTYKSVDRKCYAAGEDFQSQKTNEPYEGYMGMMVLKTASDDQPSVCDRNPNIALDKDDPHPYAGDYVDVYARIYAVKGDEKGGNGIFCSLDVVQYRKEGTPFGAAKVDPTKVMDTIDEDDDDTTSTAAAADGDEEDEDLLAGL